MFGFFKRKRENGSVPHHGAPQLTAELRELQDREFADRLHQRLVEKGGGKVEPKFRSAAGPKPAPVPPPPTAPRVAAERTATRPAPPEPPKHETPREPKAPPTAAAPEAPSVRPEPPQAAAKRAAAPITKPVVAAADERPAPAIESLPALPLVMRAAQFAAERHKNQRRRGAAREPYVNHLLEVASLVATATQGRDPELVIAGLLHDLIEDQGVSADDIARQFGVAVAALVLEVTTDKSLSDGERSRLQIAQAAHKSPRARMLRIADLTSNLRALRQSPPSDWSVERQRDYFQWAHDVVAASRGLSPHLDGAFDEAYRAGSAALSTAAE